jgi:hypothetical protein
VVDFSAKVKAKAYPKEEIYALINKITDLDIRVYLAMSFAMANRSGELLPYQHYSTKYMKDNEGNLLKVKGDKGDYGVIESRTPSWVSYGVDVGKIHYKYDSEGEAEIIVIDEVPVFKTRQMTFDKGYIYRGGNPFFNEIKNYIDNRKSFLSINKRVVYLFEKESGDTPERFFWRFKKRVQKAVKEILPGGMIDFKLHSLRTSRATDSAEASGGDIFYVQAITRHRELKNLQQYVQPVQMEKKIKQYEGDKLD